jgi:hypothetical protein
MRTACAVEGARVGRGLLPVDLLGELARPEVNQSASCDRLVFAVA